MNRPPNSKERKGSWRRSLAQNSIDNENDADNSRQRRRDPLIDEGDVRGRGDDTNDDVRMNHNEYDDPLDFKFVPYRNSNRNIEEENENFDDQPANSGLIVLTQQTQISHQALDQTLAVELTQDGMLCDTSTMGGGAGQLNTNLSSRGFGGLVDDSPINSRSLGLGGKIQIRDEGSEHRSSIQQTNSNNMITQIPVAEIQPDIQESTNQ